MSRRYLHELNQLYFLRHFQWMCLGQFRIRIDPSLSSALRPEMSQWHSSRSYTRTSAWTTPLKTTERRHNITIKWWIYVVNGKKINMVKRCAWGTFNTDSRYPKRQQNGVYFTPSPKPQQDKCVKWIRLHGRPEYQLNLSLLYLVILNIYIWLNVLTICIVLYCF